MFQRKIVVILISAFISVSLISSYFVWRDGEPAISFFLMSIVIGSFAVPAIALYGLPVTLLAERWTSKLSRVKQSILSLFIHVLFGVAFVFIIGLFLDPRLLFTNFDHFWSDLGIFFIPSVGTSICVWAVDQAMKCCVLINGERYPA